MRILATLLFAAIPAFAQVSTANVSGEVQDTSGARIASVTVKLLNLQTGNENTATTGPTGSFLIPGVLPGLYSMQVQRDGFAAVHLTGLNLNVGESRQFLIKLRLSTVEETVEVDASGQNLNTEDAQMTTVIDSHLLQEIPLNGRSFQDLIAMTPGAVSISPQLLHSGGFSINGQPSDTNVYWVDGISGNFGAAPLNTAWKTPSAGQYSSVTSLGTTQGLVSLDALQEFRVISSTASAEYGSTFGGQFSLLTRQGTNQIHATAYAYLRNGYFDAFDWFAEHYNLGDYFYYYQQDIGGSLSMPLTFKWQHAEQSQTYFFGSYEVLKVEQRTGPTSAYLPGYNFMQQAPTAVQNAFQAFSSYSTSTDDERPLIQYLDEESSPASFFKSMDFRIDHRFSSRLSGFARFGDTPSSSESGFFLMGGVNTLSNQSLTLGLDGQLSSHAGNEFRIGWARSGASFVSQLESDANPDFAKNLSDALGSPASHTETRSQLYFGVAGIGDITSWSDSSTNALRQLEVRDTFSLQHGPHMIQVGIDLRNLHSMVTPLPWSIEADYLSANSVLNNSADALVVSRNEPSHPDLNQFAAFVQDQWRVTPNLNISAGLRWDIAPPPGSTDGRDAFRVNGDINSPETLSVSPRGTALWSTDWHAIGPRIGIAWHPGQASGHETILRGGLGVVYDTPNRAAMPSFTALGFSSTTVQRNASIPTTAAAATPSSPDVAGPGSLGYLFPRNLAYPYSLQWSISAEHAIGEHQSVVLSYVGAGGHDLPLPQRRTVTSSATPLQEVVTFPSGFSSRFDSMQLVYRGQYRSRLSWMSSYVWAHTLDFGSINPWATPTRSSADTDVRHNLQIALSWNPTTKSTHRFLRNALSGWGIDGRYFLRSAYPITVLGNLFNDPITGERFYSAADLIPGRPLYLFDNSLPGGRMLNGGPNVANGAFQLPSGNAEGNAPRNLSRGFNAQQFSFSLRRDVHLYKRLYLQLRGDAFNISNDPDFGYIVPNLTDQLFGQSILSLNQSYGQNGPLYQSGGPRSLQWMFRLRW